MGDLTHFLGNGIKNSLDFWEESIYRLKATLIIEFYNFCWTAIRRVSISDFHANDNEINYGILIP